MTAQEPSSRSTAEVDAQNAADRLALALEDVGFDVGRAFPMLLGGVDRNGAPVVDLGTVSVPIAMRLAEVLARVG